jgi:hypothetical protein
MAMIGSVKWKYNNNNNNKQLGEMMGRWRKLHNEEFQNLYSSPSIIWMVKSWRMRWTEHHGAVWVLLEPTIRVVPILRVVRFSKIGATLAVTSRAVNSYSLLVTTNVGPSSLILSTLKMESTTSSETWVITIRPRGHIPQDCIFHSLPKS